VCLQDDDSDFLCSYASDLYGNIPKGKCGGAFYFVVFVQREKKKSKTKRRNKVPQEKKREKEKENKKNRVVSCIVFEFNKRLEENKKVVPGIA
jgi:hypothetical protein